MLLIIHKKISGVINLRTAGFDSIARLSLMSMKTVILLMTTILITASPAARVLALPTSNRVYRYFGYGSNVLPSTMKALRQIEVREVTAAILPDYELKFSSAAFVRPVLPTNREVASDAKYKNGIVDGQENSTRSRRVVHGILYTLTEDEFAKVGQTEGVPFGYRWQSCQVYPYRGDSNLAGISCLNDPDAVPVQAYTLVEPAPVSSQRQQQRGWEPVKWKRNNERQDIPPSASYLGLIREGARLWKFDRRYQNELASFNVMTSNNLLFSEGWEGPTLAMAEKATGTERTYMIDGY